MLEHYEFFKRYQGDSETFDEFLTDLKKLATSGEFREKYVLIKDKILLGIRDSRCQKKLLQYPSLQLREAVEICHAMKVV